MPGEGALHVPVLSCFVEEKLKACGCSKHSLVFCLVEVWGFQYFVVIVPSESEKERIFLVSCTRSWNSCTFRLILSSFRREGVVVFGFKTLPVLPSMIWQPGSVSAQGMDFTLFQCIGYTGISGKVFCTAQPTPPELTGMNEFLPLPYSWQVDQEVREPSVRHLCTGQFSTLGGREWVNSLLGNWLHPSVSALFVVLTTFAERSNCPCIPPGQNQYSIS